MKIIVNGVVLNSRLTNLRLVSNVIENSISNAKDEECNIFLPCEFEIGQIIFIEELFDASVKLIEIPPKYRNSRENHLRYIEANPECIYSRAIRTQNLKYWFQLLTLMDTLNVKTCNTIYSAILIGFAILLGNTPVFEIKRLILK